MTPAETDMTSPPTLAELVGIAYQLHVQRLAASAKTCTEGLDKLHDLFSVPQSDLQSTLAGIPVFINEEIPPDRIVFYDFDDEVLEVVSLPGLNP